MNPDQELAPDPEGDHGSLLLLVVVLLLVGLWAFQTANRLDRLHVRYDLSWQALDGRGREQFFDVLGEEFSPSPDAVGKAADAYRYDPGTLADVE